MLVKAAPGTRCPKPGRPREYIADCEPGVEVPDEDIHYLRLLKEGSLVPAGVEAAQAPEPAAKKKKEA